MAVEWAVVFSSGAVGMSRCGEKGWKKHSVEVVDSALDIFLSSCKGSCFFDLKASMRSWMGPFTRRQEDV